ncbi:hypothetical protein Bbelb_352700 [Branchiostoma belcheri]|nr:hypothetical protein Bbelb_352700 [Branchiostoma belcheri]
MTENDRDAMERGQNENMALILQELVRENNLLSTAFAKCWKSNIRFAQAHYGTPRVLDPWDAQFPGDGETPTSYSIDPATLLNAILRGGKFSNPEASYHHGEGDVEVLCPEATDGHALEDLFAMPQAAATGVPENVEQSPHIDLYGLYPYRGRGRIVLPAPRLHGSSEETKGVRELEPLAGRVKAGKKETIPNVVGTLNNVVEVPEDNIQAALHEDRAQGPNMLRECSGTNHTHGKEGLGVTMYLTPGTYQYKYKRQDREWFHDHSQESIPDVFGTFNNVVEVPEDSIQAALHEDKHSGS